MMAKFERLTLASEAQADAATAAVTETVDNNALVQEKMQDSNTITDKSRVESERRFKLAERPWIGIQGTVVAQSVIKVGTRIKIVVAGVNAGRSPALDVRSCSYIGPTLPPDSDLKRAIGRCEKMAPGVVFSKSLVVPNGTFMLVAESNIVVSESLLARLKEPQTPPLVYSWGWITYRDSLGTEYYTTYGQFIDTIDPLDMAATEYGNEAK